MLGIDRIRCRHEVRIEGDVEAGPRYEIHSTKSSRSEVPGGGASASSGARAARCGKSLRSPRTRASPRGSRVPSCAGSRVRRRECPVPLSRRDRGGTAVESPRTTTPSERAGTGRVEVHGAGRGGRGAALVRFSLGHHDLILSLVASLSSPASGPQIFTTSLPSARLPSITPCARRSSSNANVCVRRDGIRLDACSASASAARPTEAARASQTCRWGKSSRPWRSEDPASGGTSRAPEDRRGARPPSPRQTALAS